MKQSEYRLRSVLFALTMTLTLVLVEVAAAQQPQGVPFRGRTALAECPETAQLAMNDDFGEGTSALTQCLAVRHRIAVVVNWNRALTNKAGISQQATSTKNLVDNYEQMYGMEDGHQYTAVVIGYGQGGRWLLTDEAYDQTYEVSTGNPSGQIVEYLLEQGVPIYMCQNSMRANGWVSSDLLPGVKMVPSGVNAVVDYEMLGYRPLNP